MRFLLTRPREDSEKLARNLTRLGHSSLIDPLITIEPCGPGKINLSLYEAVLLTSANGARALARTTDKRDIPLFAVGEATANAAELTDAQLALPWKQGGSTVVGTLGWYGADPAMDAPYSYVA